LFQNLAFLEIRSEISYDSFTLLRRACLREFAIFDDSSPIDALRTYLVRHPKDLNHISPRKLELLVGSVFSDFFDCDIQHIHLTFRTIGFTEMAIADTNSYLKKEVLLIQGVNIS